MATLLTDFTDLVQRIVKAEMPQQDKLEQMADTLEGVTDELKTYCSSWKTATQQAENGARQLAQGNEETEEMKKNMAGKNEELEERRKQMQKQEEELFGRLLELELKERLFEDRRVELEKKEKLLQQQSLDLERTELTSRIQHARLQSEAALVQSKESKVVQEWHIFQAKMEASKEADIQRKNWEEGLRKREENLQLTYQSVLALNDTVNKNLAGGRNERDEDPKAGAAASKTKADWQRTLVHHSVSRYDESRAKRGLGPGSPEKPVSKRRCHTRRSSVGSAGMLTNFGPPEPLPEDIMERIRSPRGLGKVVRRENTRREIDSSPSRSARTPSGAQGPLGSSIESSSSMDPATAFNTESSSPGTLIQSSEGTGSATDPEGLSEASDEVKDVWRQIEFPIDWDLSASNRLLQALKKNIRKNIPQHFRPAGLMDSSSAKQCCLVRRLAKIKSAIDNGDDKSCSACTRSNVQCVRASLVAEDLAEVAYDANSQEKRWRLTIREV